MISSLRKHLLPVAIALVPACSGSGGGEDPTVKAKMANDLVQCQNDRSSLKDKISDLESEIAKLKAATDKTQHLDGIEVSAGGNTGEVHHEGNLPPDKVFAVLKMNSGGLKSCYEKGLKRNTGLRYVTSVNVRFAVKNTGNAVGVSFSPRTDPDMESCMAAAIQRWKFPTFSGDPVQFEAPVNLVAK